MRCAGDSPILGRNDCNSQAVATQTLEKKPIQSIKGIKRRISPQEAEILLQKHCRGIWTDSDEDVDEKSNPQEDAMEANEEKLLRPLSPSDTWETSRSPSTQPNTKTKRKKRKKLEIDGRNGIAPKPSESPDAIMNYKASHQDQREPDRTTAEAEKDVRSHQWRKHLSVEWKAASKPSKRQLKGLRRWNSMQLRKFQSSKAEASECATNSAVASSATHAVGQNTKSLQLLKELGGVALACTPQEGRADELAEVKKQSTSGRGEEQKRTQEAQKVFDETVHEIRNLVYPHLGRFQRRQFVTTALRALGIDSIKTQKMPLPELLSRKKATAEALKARRAEAKILGVSSHIDFQGSVQQAARNRSKLTAQKQMRKHLRETFKHAGKYTRKL